jgi:hypothetical protein
VRDGTALRDVAEGGSRDGMGPVARDAVGAKRAIGAEELVGAELAGCPDDEERDAAEMGRFMVRLPSRLGIAHRAGSGQPRSASSQQVERSHRYARLGC